MFRAFLSTALLCLSLLTHSHAAAPSPSFSDPNATVSMKPAEQSLRDSGPALAFSGLVMAGVGLAAGVDISDFLRHGQFLAFAAQLKGLDVNFTACGEGIVGAQSKATCPTNQNEKVFTRWSYWFNLYGLNWNMLPSENDDEGNLDPFAADVRLSRCVGTVVAVLLVVGICTGLQFQAFKMTVDEEKDYDDALNEAYAPPKKDGGEGGHTRQRTLRDIGNVAPKRCFDKLSPNFPQVVQPCFPVRYWFHWPNLQLKLLLTFHFSICAAAMAAVASNEGAGPTVGIIVLLFVCAPLPFVSFYIVKKYLEPTTKKDTGHWLGFKQQFDIFFKPDPENDDKVLIRYKKDMDIYKLVGGIAYRDVDHANTQRGGKAHYVKPWRQSVLVAKWSAPFYNIKFKRRHWTHVRLIVNFIEAGILTGVLPAGRASVDGFEAARPDYVTIAAACFYLIDFGIILTLRPHYRCGRTVMGLLQCFHNLMITMASVLYVNDGIMNTQDLLKIETDGVELMITIVACMGTVTWMLFIGLESLLVFNRTYSQMSQPELNWDVESDLHRRNNIKGTSSMGGSAFSALTERSDGGDGGLPPMLAMLQMSRRENANEQVAEDPAEDPVENPVASNTNPMHQRNATFVPPTPAQSPAAPTPAVAETAAPEKNETPPVASNELPAGWATVQDPASGRTYYYNASTQKTSWSKPTGAEENNSLPAGWQKVDDPNTGGSYYYNTSTQETSWTKPTGAVENNSLPAGWNKVDDPKTGGSYYYNATTRETSWTLPGV